MNRGIKITVICLIIALAVGSIGGLIGRRIKNYVERPQAETVQDSNQSYTPRSYGSSATQPTTQATVLKNPIKPEFSNPFKN